MSRRVRTPTPREQVIERYLIAKRQRRAVLVVAATPQDARALSHMAAVTADRLRLPPLVSVWDFLHIQQRRQCQSIYVQVILMDDSVIDNPAVPREWVREVVDAIKACVRRHGTLA